VAVKAFVVAVLEPQRYAEACRDLHIAYITTAA
jgi:hypothetical protein